MSQTGANIPLILRLVSETTSIVNIAGSIVRKVLKSGELDVVDKGINDLQTKADRAAQQYIVQKLSSSFPKALIIGEEGNDISESLVDLLSPATSPSSATIPLLPFPEILMKTVPEHISNISEDQVVIWVDPLDGTAEFTQGLVTHVTVLVGIAVNGKAIGGVIHQPFYKKDGIDGRTMWGIPDVGFGGFDLIAPPQGKRIITTTRSHCTPSVEAALSALEPDDVLRVGGAGHKAILLMEGQAHAYVFATAGCKKWDTCAPEAILRAVGGELTDMNGELYKYHKDVQHKNDKGLLATAPGEDHAWYVNRVRSKGCCS